MENKTSAVVLVIVIVIAGIFVALRLMKIGSSTAPAAGNVSAPSSQTTGVVATPVSLPTPPSANASKDELNQFGQKISSLAENSNILEIGTGCMVSPSVMRMSVGTQLTFRNKDTVRHQISMGEMTDVPAEGQKIITAQFKGPGIYGINCDGAHLVGFLELVK